MPFALVVSLLVAASTNSSSSTCQSCLKESHTTHFWCVSDSTCRPFIQDQSNPFGTCAIPETHDLVFNATDCCSTKLSYQDCVAGSLISFCQWCQNTTQGSGLCLYKYDNSLSKKICRTPPESFTKCTSLTSCKQCTDNILCTWCEDSRTCLTKESQTDVNSPYYCPTTTTNCCFDLKTCEECSRESGAFDHQNCVWCYGSNQCKTLNSALESCDALNRLGVGYCKDRCTSRSSSCQSCTAESGCVWINNLKWTQQIGVPRDIKNLCVAGSFSGPNSKVIDYQSSNKGRYEFVIDQFYFMSCTLTFSAMISLIVGVLVSIVILIILVLIVVSIIKRIRYAKALKRAREDALNVEQAVEIKKNDIDEDSDAAEQNEISRLIKPMSWE